MLFLDDTTRRKSPSAHESESALRWELVVRLQSVKRRAELQGPGWEHNRCPVGFQPQETYMYHSTNPAHLGTAHIASPLARYTRTILISSYLDLV